jgi:hypothetical protein
MRAQDKKLDTKALALAAGHSEAEWQEIERTLAERGVGLDAVVVVSSFSKEQWQKIEKITIDVEEVTCQIPRRAIRIPQFAYRQPSARGSTVDDSLCRGSHARSG